MCEIVTAERLEQMRKDREELKRRQVAELAAADSVLNAALAAFVVADLRDMLIDYWEYGEDDINQMQLVIPGTWSCPDPEYGTPELLNPDKPNPVKTCIYDVAVDPCMDGCLYCGGPYERK